MLGYKSNDCVLILNRVINESNKLNKTCEEYLLLHETGDSENQTNYVSMVLKGKVISLIEEANYVLSKCHTNKDGDSMFINFLMSWHSTFDTLSYVYKNNIYGRKVYEVTENLITHSKKDLDRYFYHFKDCSDVYCPEMVVIPPGTFWMGGFGHDEYPRHKAVVEKSFAIGLHEVTIEQFLEFTKVAGHIVPNGGTTVVHNENGIEIPFLNNINYNKPQGDQNKLNIKEPVTCLRKEDTRLFIRWLSSKTNQTYRLPTEAEWEYVSRSNLNQFSNYNETACLYENLYDLSESSHYLDFAFKCNDHSRGISKVGSYLPNYSGIYDMMGNVQEWVDCYYPPFINALSSSSGELCSYGIFKGGSWASGPNEMKISMRKTIHSTQIKSNTIGFRLVREIK